MKVRVKLIGEDSLRGLEEAINYNLQDLSGNLVDIKFLWDGEGKYDYPYCAMIIYTPEES